MAREEQQIVIRVNRDCARSDSGILHWLVCKSDGVAWDYSMEMSQSMLWFLGIKLETEIADGCHSAGL
jgi:hypothetical protein